MENKKIFKNNGLFILIALVAILALFITAIIFSIIALDEGRISGGTFTFTLVLSILVIVAAFISLSGLKIVKPNEALVLTLFGNFYAVIQEPGFYFVNPFAQATFPKEEGGYGVNMEGSDANSKVSVRIPNTKISLKAMTLDNSKQKVNDANGNPIEIGVVVIWKVVDPVKAVFNVDDYRKFVAIQSDGSIRSVARKYAYDSEDGEKSLTGSTKEISDKLQEIIQEAVTEGGIEIIDAKIAHLSYATEIANAMLQRQQADAIIAARQKIVEGAVGMVEQALADLSKRQVVELDDERKAQMVTNLLVVLCANKEAQPVVNSGSIY